MANETLKAKQIPAQPMNRPMPKNKSKYHLNSTLFKRKLANANHSIWNIKYPCRLNVNGKCVKQQVFSFLSTIFSFFLLHARTKCTGKKNECHSRFVWFRNASGLRDLMKSIRYNQRLNWIEMKRFHSFMPFIVKSHTTHIYDVDDDTTCAFFPSIYLFSGVTR